MRVHGARSGFSLLEVVVGTSAFAAIGYVLLLAVKASSDSQRAINTKAEQHRVLRETSRALVDELALASDDTISFSQVYVMGVGTVPTLRFRERIEEGGMAGFGATHLGVPHADWNVVYEVQEPAGDVRRLVRRVEDEAGVTQASKVVVRGLRDDDEDPPGFRVVQAGDLWEITLSTEGQGNQRGMEEVFHVRARN